MANEQDGPKVLRLPQALDDLERQELAANEEALRTLVNPVELATADHEALLALALGQEVVVDDDERREASRLRDALDGEGQHALEELASSLRAASPAEGSDLGVIMEADHEALLALALGVEATVQPREQGEAEALRQALDGATQAPLAEGATQAPLAEFAGALRSLHEAAKDDVQADELVVARALRRAMRRFASGPRRLRGMVIGGVLAAAAAVALFVGQSSIRNPERSAHRSAASPPAALVRSRSTQDLFDPMEPFARTGGESERLSRIVASRAADLRANRFAAWGVR